MCALGCVSGLRDRLLKLRASAWMSLKAKPEARVWVKEGRCPKILLRPKKMTYGNGHRMEEYDSALIFGQVRMEDQKG